MDKNIIISLVVILAIIATYLVVRFLMNKYGKDKTEALVAKVKEGLDQAHSINNTFSTVVPESVTNIVDKIISYAYVVVAAVEQGYKKGTIDKDLRKDTAMEKIFKMLSLAGIEVTDEMTPVMDDAIEAEVSRLPKTHIVTKMKKNQIGSND